jgi:hypothetical protein
MLVEKSGRLHQRAVPGLLETADGSDDVPRRLLAEFSANLETIATSQGKQPPVLFLDADRDRLRRSQRSQVTASCNRARSGASGDDMCLLERNSDTSE